MTNHPGELPSRPSSDPPGATQVASPDPIVLADRWRNGIAGSLVGLAVIHFIFPGLAIDAVTLGLIAFAGLVKLFDIDSIEWLGIKARKSDLLRKAEQVKAVPIPTAEPRLAVPPFEEGVFSELEIPTVHRPPADLMPPVDKVDRLYWSVEQIRIELIVLAGNSGHLPSRQPWDSYGAVILANVLSAKGIIPPELIDPINTVVETRNVLAHGHFGPKVISDSAGSLALEVVSKLRAIPRNWVRVSQFPIELFGDQSMSTLHEVNPGVMVEQLNNDGVQVNVQVFPTHAQYVESRYVTWEWDNSEIAKREAWYLDSSTQRPKLAFSRSSLFAGREYPEQWGMPYRVAGPVRP